MTDLAQRFLSVIQKIEATALAVERKPASVQLLAVSKTFESVLVDALWHKGQRAFGENYVQEALAKIEALKNLRTPTNPIEWHLIGPLQSNKTAVVAEHFDWVQTVDRLKIAQRLNDQRPAHLPPLNVCIQVNVDGGITKSGIDCRVGSEALLDLARQVHALPRLTLRGLLAIPEPELDVAKQQAVFAKVKTMFDYLNQHGCNLDTLSMGMSADFEAAIAAGSTMVRVGSAIFGERPKNA
jgi:pyridoxal phosphate enzyme (YggS family)